MMIFPIMGLRLDQVIVGKYVCTEFIPDLMNIDNDNDE